MTCSMAFLWTLLNTEKKKISLYQTKQIYLFLSVDIKLRWIIIICMYWTFVFILFMIFTTFRPLYPPDFFRCLQGISNWILYTIYRNRLVSFMSRDCSSLKLWPHESGFQLAFTLKTWVQSMGQDSVKIKAT